MNPDEMALVQEAQRRRAGGQPSGAGISGGMPQTNAQSPANPVAQQGVSVPASQSAYGGAVKALNQGGTSEKSMIIKGLLRYLERAAQ